ncbi:MAG: cupin domain-containing protein [Planctomycetota bacterium]|jgi:quercetin dioxygenase-like cupin family protein
MKLIRDRDVRPVEVRADKDGKPAERTSVQVMVPEGPNFVLRVFTLGPGGRTPLHAHPWEHEVYVLAGRGRAAGESEFDLTPGDTVYVAPGEEHCFLNAGEDDLRFVCVVPADVGPARPAPPGPDQQAG